MYATVGKRAAEAEAAKPKAARTGSAPTRRSGLPLFIAAAVDRPDACESATACANDGTHRETRVVGFTGDPVQRTPESPPATADPEPADAGAEAKGEEGGTAGGSGTAAPCTPTALSRADYLKRPGTSTNDFGLTSVAVSTADVPRLETVNAPRGRGFVVRKTPDVMPPITSVFTQAGTFEEGEAHVLGDGDCPAGKYPIRWTITASGADKIREGEVEHCADYQLAWQRSMARYATVVNDLAARGTTFASHAAAARHIQRIVGPHPDDWFSTYECLLRKSLIRDGAAGAGGWHKPRLVPAGRAMPPRLKDNCAFARAFITADSLPEVGKHPSADIIKDCNEGPPAKKRAPSKAAPKSKAAGGVKTTGATIRARVGETAPADGEAASEYEPRDVGEELGRAFEIIEYGNYLSEHRDIEGMPTSGMKALDYARRRLAGERLALPPNGDALLIIELLHVAPDAEMQAAALALLERMDTEQLLAMVSRAASDEPGRIGVWQLAGSFEGDTLMRVLDFLSRRFEGDFTGLLKGTGPLAPTEDAELDARTLDWLQTHRKSAERFFDEVWAANAVVLLGETHHEGNRQRLFAADMIRRHGGPEVTLALETRHQAGVDAYLNNRDADALPDWFVPGEYHQLLDAARATGTIVDAVDVNLPSYDPGRDEAMAGSVEAWQGIGSRVLFYGGALHIREAAGHHRKPLGRLLAGGAAAGYAINMAFRDTLTSGFFGMLRRRFPDTASIGFDVDQSPLRWRRDPDIHDRTDVGENLDGYIYFLQRCAAGPCARTACSGVRVSQPGDAEEREAEAVARALVGDARAGAQAPPSAHTTQPVRAGVADATVQRQPLAGVPEAERESIVVRTVTPEVPAGRVRAMFEVAGTSGEPSTRRSPGEPVAFDAGIQADPPNVRTGLTSVAADYTDTAGAGATGPRMPAGTTIEVNLRIAAFGGRDGRYRFSRYSTGGGASAIYIEFAGPLPAAAPAIAAPASGTFTVGGSTFRLDGTWSDDDHSMLREAIALLPPAALQAADGLTFRRMTGSAIGGENGRYDPQTDTVELFQDVFRHSGTTPARAETAAGGRRPGVFEILHEIGHALDLRPLFTAWAPYEQAADALNRAVDEYNRLAGHGGGLGALDDPLGGLDLGEPASPDAIEAARGRMETARAAADAARADLLRARAQSGERWQASEVQEGGETRTTFSAVSGTAGGPGSFQQAATADGVAADTTGRTTPQGTTATLSGGTTSYADTDWGELYAESFALYTLDPELLRATRPHIFEYLARRYPHAAGTGTGTSAEGGEAVPVHRCAAAGGGGCGSGHGLRVSQPWDPEEREAETVARKVAGGGPLMSAHRAMGMPRPAPHISNGGDPGAAGGPLHARPRLPEAVPATPEPGPAPLTSAVTPLSPALRAYFEPRLGVDLGHVRVHTGAAAADSARAFAARAYTLGGDIVFGAGEYRPDTTAGRTLLAHELVHVAQQRRGLPGAAVRRQPSAHVCDVRRPENCATYEQWLFAFRSLPTFTSEDGVRLAQGGHPMRFRVLGAAPASRDPNAPAADRPPDPRGTRTADRFIDHPTDEWVRRNLPDNLRATAYQLPADCADILVILRHVYLSAHHRTERYGDWLVGDAQGEAAQRRVGGVIAEAATVNLERVVNPYIDANGQPIRDFARLEPLLHPGDQLVWDHHDDGLDRPRTGGHSQTIMEIHRASGGRITSIDVLQGNQPLFERQAREIIDELNRERAAAGSRPLPRSQTTAGGPLEMSLRHSPGRRIEVSSLEQDELQDVELPRRRGSSSAATRVWTWGDAGNTILEVAGAPRSSPRPRMTGRGSARRARISDWLGSLRSASATGLHGVFEGALHETRAVIDGGGTVSTSDATDLATTAGGRLWQLARRAVGRLVAFGRRTGDLARGDLGDRAHFEPLYRIRAMIRALGGIEPPTYHGNPAEAADVRTTFVVIDREFDFAARGGDDIAFNRTIRRGGELVRVLVTGFDPFDPTVSGPPAAGEWNPSGAAALSMDGSQVALGGRDVAAVEGVVLPVSFAQFRAGIVERAVQAAGANVDAVLSVSLDPNLATTDPVRIEQFAVGVHQEADIQPHRLVATETVAHPGLRTVTPGGPPIAESNTDVAAVAAETAGRERRGLPSVLQPTIGRDVTLRFASAADAASAAAALGAGAAAGRNLVLRDEAVVRAVMTSARPVSSAPGANAEITFRAGSTTVRATLVRGPGGSFLSNEVFYRVRSEIARTGADTVSFHVHTPGAAAIPQAAGTRAERRARQSALGTARDAVVTLVATLRRMVASVGRRVAAARRAGGGTP